MPSAKRARQRAAKQAKQAEIQRRSRQRRVRRNVLIGVVVVAVGVLIYFGTSGGSKNANHSSSAAAHSTASSGSSPSSTTSSAATDTQAAVDKVAAAAGCPSNPKAALHKGSYSQPPMTIDTAKTYTATVQTDVGTFTMSLDAKQSPIAVNSFVFLADKGFFNCVTFHRVIPGFVVQGGDPTGTGTGGPGYQFTEAGPPAASNPAQQYPLGSVAMANSSSGTTDPSTNGSQFFIVTGSQGESLPPDYVLFGQVTSGMPVVQKINDDGTQGGTPRIIHRMLKVTVTSS